jgi:hypothetical protein
VPHQKQLLFSVGNYLLSIFCNIKFEHRICLNNNLKKRHDLGHLSFSLNGAKQIIMSKLDKRLPKNDTKFGDHLSIISVGIDVQKFFNFWL